MQLTSTTNLSFTFGDGEDTTDVGSAITAVTTIDANPAPASGSYNFDDVTLTGALNFPTTPSLLFVAATPTGDAAFRTEQMQRQLTPTRIVRLSSC